MHSFTKVMLIAYIFTTQWIYGEKKHDSGFFKFLWWSNWAWELRSCEQTNTEKFEGSGSIHPSSYEFRQSRRQKAFLTFVYELETHYSDGQRVLFGCWVVFFFLPQKGNAFFFKLTETHSKISWDNFQECKARGHLQGSPASSMSPQWLCFCVELPQHQCR